MSTTSARTTPDYIDELEARRRAGGWTHAEFAAELGVSLAAWNRVKSRRRRPGTGFLRLATRRFPELDSHVAPYLRSMPAGEPACVE